VFASFRGRWSERALAEMPSILISRENCFMFRRAIVADRVAVHTVHGLKKVAEVNVITHGHFLTFCFCRARHLASEWVNGDGGGGPPVGVYGKVAARNEDGVAHVSYRYLMNTYITSYNAINI